MITDITRRKTRPIQYTVRPLPQVGAGWAMGLRAGSLTVNFDNISLDYRVDVVSKAA